MIHAERMDHMIACLLVCLILFARRSQGTPIGHTVTSKMRQRLIQAITDHVFSHGNCCFEKLESQGSI
jgi:hypothetical protein